MSTLNATAARRYAVYGRSAGIVLLVCAGALWAVPLPGMTQLPAKPVIAPPPPATQTAAANTPSKVTADVVDETSTRLEMAWVHTEAKPVAEAPKEPEHVEPASSGPEWTYLGPIHEADRSLAIISVDSHQKILPEGRTFGDTKLVKVADSGIDVEINGAPKHIARGSRGGSTVAWVRNFQSAQPLVRAGVPAVAGAAPGNIPQNLPPEVRQRLMDRGINPEQMQNWRGRNGGQGGGGPGGRNRAMPGGGGGGDMRGAIEATKTNDAVTITTIPLNGKPGTDRAVPVADDRRRSAN